MDKGDAQKEALRLWHALPMQDRNHHKKAVAFAATIAPQLPFETLGDHDKVVEGWLVRDFLAHDKPRSTPRKPSRKT